VLTLTGRNSRLLVLVLSTVFFANRLPGQNSGAPDAAKDATISTDKLGELLDSVRELKAQVRELNGHLNDVTAAQAQSEAEAKRLRQELELASQRIKLLEGPAKNESSIAQNYDVPAAQPAESRAVSVGVRGVAPDETIDQKLARLEENTELLDAKVADQYQTKVESGAKYRLRLSGIVLFNLYGNTGAVNNQDFPEVAMASGGLLSDRAFGGSLRQSQIGIDGFGPDLAGAHTSARVRLDFAGDTVEDANGALMGQIRLRTATFRMDWENTSLVAGQDALFFAPLAPTSLASLAVPALSYSGNLWGWTPQVRVEHKIKLKNDSEIHLTAGILDQITGDYASSGQERVPSWGEQSGQPGFAAHIGWTKKIAAGTMGIGAGGYYGRQFWGFDRHVDSWTGAVDLQLPITSYLEFTAAYYRGRAVGGFGGGIAQSVLLTGPFGLASSSVRGLDSQGGWAQITLKPRRDFKINGAFGQDNPFAWQVRAYPVVPSGYEEPLTKNQSWFVNGIYQFRSNILFSLEFRRFATHDLGPDGYVANSASMSLGYIF
jgi:hypothetical protein